jgi:Holliday junction resolvasome RuvABC endonuclease subunit
MVKSIKILGIDPGFADVGFGMITKTGRSLSLVATGIRISKIALLNVCKSPSEVNFLLKQYQPDIVSVESFILLVILNGPRCWAGRCYLLAVKRWY